MADTAPGAALRSRPRLTERMARRVPDLARRAVEQITVELPMYRALPQEEVCTARSSTSSPRTSGCSCAPTNRTGRPPPRS